MFWTKNNPKNLLPKRVIDALQANFNDHELVELSKLGTPIEVDAGMKLTVEGTIGKEALILVDGIAEVVRNGETVATLRGGDVVGEIALLTGEPRNATVQATTAVSLYAMSAREFASLLSRCPRLDRSVNSTAVHRATVNA